MGERTSNEASSIQTILSVVRTMREARTKTNEGDVEIWQAYNDAADRLDVLLSKISQQKHQQTN